MLPNVDQKKRSALGQFMTPSTVARFMASLFAPGRFENARLLDAGAGIGALTCAFLDRAREGGIVAGTVEVDAYEVDAGLREHLSSMLAGYAERGNVQARVIGGDFIEQGSEQVEDGMRPFTHAILNPPYKKINTNSRHRLALRRAGIETVNLYSGFVALAIEMLQDGGQLVVIMPRSFCNGPYYLPFRRLMLDRAAIRQMHLFDARDKAFRDDEVLQETVILHLERGAPQGSVKVSTSTDDSFADYVEHELAFERIVRPGDSQCFIHIPVSGDDSTIETSAVARSTLADLGLKVSTGPVVDFRVRAHLRAMPEAGCAPLLYPGHFRGMAVVWPQPEAKKPNAIMRNAETEKWLYPRGFYTIVRRFSAKEERRRVVASVVDPASLGDAEMVGLENHLNVFHAGRKGLSREMALGLAVYLNTTAVDEHLRRFNGHTQVNATDLKALTYPSADVLLSLGRWALEHRAADQAAIDACFEALA